VTVFDMAVALTISAVVALTTFPVVSSLHAEYQLANAANLVGFEIVRARSQAVAQNKKVRLHVENNYESGHGIVFWREVFNPDNNQWERASDYTSVSRVSVASLSTIEFSKAGLATTSTDVTVSNDAGSRVVQTTSIGRVSVL